MDKGFVRIDFTTLNKHNFWLLKLKTGSFSNKNELVKIIIAPYIIFNYRIKEENKKIVY